MTSVNIDLLTINDERPWFQNVEPEHEEFFNEMGYKCVCKIHGKTVGMTQMLFTVGLVVGLDEHGYEYRYCYENASEAFAGLLNWILEGDDEPANYIKRK